MSNKRLFDRNGVKETSGFCCTTGNFYPGMMPIPEVRYEDEHRTAELY